MLVMASRRRARTVDTVGVSGRVVMVMSVGGLGGDERLALLASKGDKVEHVEP